MGQIVAYDRDRCVRARAGSARQRVEHGGKSAGKFSLAGAFASEKV